MGVQRSQAKNIWMLSREYAAIAGAGGVKDVVSQLAETLARWTGRSVHVVLPCYGFIDPGELGFIPLADPCEPEELLQCEIDMNHPDEIRREGVAFFYKKIKRVGLMVITTKETTELLNNY